MSFVATSQLCSHEWPAPPKSLRAHVGQHKLAIGNPSRAQISRSQLLAVEGHRIGLRHLLPDRQNVQACLGQMNLATTNRPTPTKASVCQRRPATKNKQSFLKRHFVMIHKEQGPAGHKNLPLRWTLTNYPSLRRGGSRKLQKAGLGSPLGLLHRSLLQDDPAHETIRRVPLHLQTLVVTLQQIKLRWRQL